MPPNKNSRRSTPVGSSSRATLRYAEREILKGQTDYPTYIKHITASAMLLADRLSKSGDVETSLADSSNTTNSSSDHHPTTRLDEISQSFLLEQRERLKELCKQNVMSHRDTEAYVAAVTGVRDDIQELQRQRKIVEDAKAKKAAENNNNNNNDDDNGHDDDDIDDGEEPPDYERILLEKVAEYKQKRVNDGLELDLDDEELVRKCCDRLGEKPRMNKRKGRGGGEEEDDELEVMNPQTGSGQQQQSSASLIDTPFRCPITGLFFSKPVKSKVCNHIYDLDGLRQILGNNNAGKANCPIPGCTNRNLTLNQVEDDVEMMMKVRRHKNRCEQEQIQRMSQEQDYDNDDDGDGASAGRGMGDGTTASMTVLD